MVRVSIFLITVALIAGMVGCGGTTPRLEYNLTISSTEGGSVITPGEGTSSCDEGTVVNIMAAAEEGYQFVNWTGDVDTIGNVNDATTTITINGDYSITANFAVKQYGLTTTSTEGGSVTTPGEGTFTYDYGTVVDLVATLDNGYQFINWTGDVDTIGNVNDATTTITINEHHSITANCAKEIWDWHDLHAIRDNLRGNYLLMNDLDSTTAGYAQLASPTANQGKGWQPIGSLFVDPLTLEIVDPVDPFTGTLDCQGYEIRDLFIGRPDEDGVGLFGDVDETGVIENLGMVNAQVTGRGHVGGLVGYNWGTVSNSYSTGAVAGERDVGGLVGCNAGTVSNSYSTGSVTGRDRVGGLVGSINWDGTVSNSYSTGSVTGWGGVGGLVGRNDGTVTNSYYNYDEVLINGENIITIGALFAEDFEQWLANDKFLDVNQRFSQEDGYYVINNVSDFKELLTFGQDGSLKFRLTNDLDLGNEANFYIPYLAGEFDGNGHKILNLSFDFDFVSQVGLFGFLASGGEVSEVRVENVNITGCQNVGSLVGQNCHGTVSNSYCRGSVTGREQVGGLVGWNCHGTVSNSYSTGSVTGEWDVTGLVGRNDGTVSNSYYNYDEVLINGENIITIGALFDEDFDQWLANDRFLDINERLSKEDVYYLINNVTDFKQLLAFGQDDSLKFRLEKDLDLCNEPNFYIPYLAAEFNGNGHKISNLSFNFDFIVEVGLFGYLAEGGKVSQVGVENVNITGSGSVGGLVGHNCGGTVNNSYSTGSVTGGCAVGGLVGSTWGTVSNSYSTGSVTGWGRVGGLVGFNHEIVSNSFWDRETSGTEESDGGTGKTTAEMQDITTFTGAAWDIIAVAHGVTNPAYTWNIVDDETYPFLSWQSVG